MKNAIGLTLLVVAVAALAQTSPTEFPTDATPVAESALQESVSGKVYAVKLPDGVSWRMEFKPDGVYQFSSSRGLSEVGKWSAQESKLCTEGKKIGASCNDIRKQGDALLLKRDNGQIVTMTVQQ